MDKDLRIYVVVAETVQADGFWIVNQECGRNAAQVGHVVSKMRTALALKETYETLRLAGYTAAEDVLERFQEELVFELEPVTTIVKCARDSREMGHVLHLLQKAKVGYDTFYDTNPEVYGTPEKLLTAITTGIVYPSDVVGITDYLPLWKHGKSL